MKLRAMVASTFGISLRVFALKLRKNKAIKYSRNCAELGATELLFHLKILKFILFYLKRSWIFATNSNIKTPISLEPNVVNLWYLKLWCNRIHSLKYLKFKIRFQRYSDKKVRVCGTDSFPLCSRYKNRNIFVDFKLIKARVSQLFNSFQILNFY